MVSKSAFKEFSMENRDGNFFLRPDRILGCFHVEHSSRPKLTLKLVTELDIEKNREIQLIEKLEMAEKKQVRNVLRISKAVDTLWSSLSEVKIPTPTATSENDSPVFISPMAFMQYNSGVGEDDDSNMDVEMTYQGDKNNELVIKKKYSTEVIEQDEENAMQLSQQNPMDRRSIGVVRGAHADENGTKTVNSPSISMNTSSTTSAVHANRREDEVELGSFL